MLKPRRLILVKKTIAPADLILINQYIMYNGNLNGISRYGDSHQDLKYSKVEGASQLLGSPLCNSFSRHCLEKNLAATRQNKMIPCRRSYRSAEAASLIVGDKDQWQKFKLGMKGKTTMQIKQSMKHLLNERMEDLGNGPILPPSTPHLTARVTQLESKMDKPRIPKLSRSKNAIRCSFESLHASTEEHRLAIIRTLDMLQAKGEATLNIALHAKKWHCYTVIACEIDETQLHNTVATTA
jgi:hypothetical protein